MKRRSFLTRMLAVPLIAMARIAHADKPIAVETESEKDPAGVFSATVRHLPNGQCVIVAIDYESWDVFMRKGFNLSQYSVEKSQK